VPIWRMQCSWQSGSALPRDQVVITPVFNDIGGFGVEDLVDDLADALAAWQSAGAAARQLTVRAYDVEGTKPVYAAATAVRNPGATTDFAGPRELALCLSFYSERNVPRKRGRVYTPYGLILGFDGIGPRPSASAQAKVLALGPIFKDLGGANVDWSVWSKSANGASAVTHYYVDDEWDVQRRRGLRPSTRVTGTTSEMT